MPAGRAGRKVYDMSAPTVTRWVYDFAEGSREMRELLGGKGSGIAEMTRVLGPELVSAGFTITTEACVSYMRGDRTSPEGLESDTEGVGELVEIALERGRAAKPALQAGVCGEHGGDPSSIRFFHVAGLDYISCSPFRVPIARVAAAQAAVGMSA